MPNLEPLKTRCIPNLESVVPDQKHFRVYAFCKIKTNDMSFVILPNILFKGQ